MRLKTWLVAAIGLGTLVVLIAVSMLASSRKAQDIYAQLDELSAHHRRVEANLQRLRSDVNLSGIFVRDYLLDLARERAPEYRERLAEFRRTSLQAVAELKTLTGGGDRIASLQTKLDEYWTTFDPLFDWSPAEKILQSASFLRREVVPRREAALALAQEIEELNDANVAVQRKEVERRHEAFRSDLHELLMQTVTLGLVVAIIVVVRLRVLERRSEEAERQMRELSQALVNTQEQERKNLSRELHDHIAQMLTGLRMDLGRIERMSPIVAPVVAECKKVIDEMFGTVRNLALGLRPSMLDDFGLQAAIEWHVRDFMSRYAIDVDLTMSGDFDSLPDKHRTCVYRLVQEAMTNCVRHAQAKRIRLAITAVNGQLEVEIGDDGRGLDSSARRRGLGLRGLEERVRELHGTITIAGTAGKGTAILARVPLPTMEAPLARAAG